MSLRVTKITSTKITALDGRRFQRELEGTAGKRSHFVCFSSSSCRTCLDLFGLFPWISSPLEDSSPSPLISKLLPVVVVVVINCFYAEERERAMQNTRVFWRGDHRKGKSLETYKNQREFSKGHGYYRIAGVVCIFRNRTGRRNESRLVCFHPHIVADPKNRWKNAWLIITILLLSFILKH